MQAIDEIIDNHRFFIIENANSGKINIGKKIKGIKVLTKPTSQKLSQNISLSRKYKTMNPE
ncbi:hypothetical protein [Coleofasciculus sp. FACHB-125]|uniref:hypothetical protein n=1 Tax=Coleofasciculus sp. FACHB-125 TaxID=2692784 RepID=UPI001F550404|nr:hypothetical protein [Coleofasciculus sp. FACHB-125]